MLPNNILKLDIELFCMFKYVFATVVQFCCRQEMQWQEVAHRSGEVCRGKTWKHSITYLTVSTKAGEYPVTMVQCAILTDIHCLHRFWL